MKKIGTTTTGSIIVEMAAHEYEATVTNPPWTLTKRVEQFARDAVREATEKKELSDYNYRTLSHNFSEDGAYHQLTVSEMLSKIKAAAPKYRGLSMGPRLAKKLRDILEQKRIS